MNTPHAHRRALVIPFLVLIIGTLVGGQLNRIDARGRIIDDTTGSPVPDVTVSYGARAVVTGADGTYEIDNLPRGARLDAQHRYYGRHAIPAEQTELRVEPLTITFEVHDAATGKGVDTPEARQPDDVSIGKGTVSGEMVVGPYPDRNTTVLICARNYQPEKVTAKGNLMNVDLKFAEGRSCPPLKTPAPTPTPSITPVPTPSAAPSPGGTPSPTPPPSGTP